MSLKVKNIQEGDTISIFYYSGEQQVKYCDCLIVKVKVTNYFDSLDYTIVSLMLNGRDKWAKTFLENHLGVKFVLLPTLLVEKDLYSISEKINDE